MTRLHTYTVVGSWPFPLDMLRHDQSAAASRDDQVMIDRYAAEHAPDDGVFQNASITLCGWNKPNTARWESFGWAVPDDLDYAMTKAFREEDRKARALRDQALSKLTIEERKALDWFRTKSAA